MRVGIDFKPLLQPVTGIGRYTAELTAELLAMQSGFYLYNYSSRFVNTDRWQKDHVTVRSIHSERRVSRLLFSQVRSLYWAMKDQVDVFWGPGHRLPFYLPRRTARVVTVHDLVWKHAGETMHPLNRWLEKRCMPAAIRQADRIVASSFHTKRDLEVEYPEAANKISVVYPGATCFPNPLAFQSLSALGINSPYILFVGTLEPRKNLKRLLMAYALLDGVLRNRTRLVIAGGTGWGDVDIPTIVSELQLDGQVIVTGYVDDTQLATLYAHARFLAMPALYEGFGLPLVEAMSFGVPALTSNCSSLPEVAGDAGVLVDPFDVDSIAKGLSTLLSDDEYRDRLASKATLNAKRFSWKHAAHEMWTVFQEAAEARSMRLKGVRR